MGVKSCNPLEPLEPDTTVVQEWRWQFRAERLFEGNARHRANRQNAAGRSLLIARTAERWPSGRRHQIANLAYWVTGTEGSNPSLSATEFYAVRTIHKPALT